MFISLLLALLSISLLLASVVVIAFRKPIQRILSRLIGEPHSDSWVQFLTFALYVVGISSAINSYRLDQYVFARTKDQVVASLTTSTWVLEVYHAVESVLSHLAWTLTFFFTVALIAFIIVRGFELKRGEK